MLNVNFFGLHILKKVGSLASTSAGYSPQSQWHHEENRMFIYNLQHFYPRRLDMSVKKREPFSDLASRSYGVERLGDLSISFVKVYV